MTTKMRFRKNKMNKNKKRLWNKKGVWMPDLVDGVTGVALGAIFFFVLFSMLTLSQAEAKSAIQGNQAMLDNSYILRTFLLTPITSDYSEDNIKTLAADLNNKGLRVVDLIRLVKSNPESEEELNLKELLEDQMSIIKQATRAKISIEYPDGGVIEFGSISKDGKIAAEELLIPTKKPGETIQVVMLVGYGGPKFYQ